MTTNKVTMNRKTSYSASPPWILRRRKPQANPTRTRTIATIAPLNNILSAVMVIAPEPTIIDQQINGILTYEGDRLLPDQGKIEGENRPITLRAFLVYMFQQSCSSPQGRERRSSSICTKNPDRQFQCSTAYQIFLILSLYLLSPLCVNVLSA